MPAAPSRPPASAASLARTAVEPTQLGSQPVSLLEVVADELVGLAALVEPVGQTLVQLRSLGLGQRCVGHVAHEDVVEAEAVAPSVDETFLRESREELADG